MAVLDIPFAGNNNLIMVKRILSSLFLKQPVFLFLTVFLVLGFPLTAKEPVKIVIMETMPVPALLENVNSCLRELGNLGYTNSTTQIIHIKAAGSREKAENELSKLLDTSRPDIIISFATLASLTAVKLTEQSGIPVVFAQVSDPLGSGIVSSMDARPESNVTGIIFTIPRRVKLRHALSVLPYSPSAEKPLRIGFIHSSYPSSMGAFRELRDAAAEIEGVEIISRIIPYESVPSGTVAMLQELSHYARELEPLIDFWWEPTGALGELEEYHETLMGVSSKPVLFANTVKSVEGGAVMTLIPALGSAGAEAAHLAHSILQGTPAGSIPIQSPRAVTAAFNRDTIMKYGLIISPGLLSLAEGNIYPRLDE